METAVIPAGVEAEAVRRIVAANPAAPAELAALAERARSTLARLIEGQRAQRVPVPVSANDVRPFARKAVEAVCHQRHYERLHRLATGDAPGGTPASPGERLAGIAREALGDAALPALHALKDSFRGTLQVELEAADARLKAWSTPGPAPAPGSAAPQLVALGQSAIDGRLKEFAALLALRQDLADRAERLAPAPDPKQAAALHARNAVKRMGIPEVLARRLVEVRTINGTLRKPDPAAPALAESERKAAEIGEAIRRLGADSVAAPGSHAAELVEQRAQAAKGLGSLRSEIDARQASAIADQVGRMLAGDDAARKAILSDVRSRPAAFPAGFAESLEWFGPEEPLEGLAAELARDLPADVRASLA